MPDHPLSFKADHDFILAVDALAFAAGLGRSELLRCIVVEGVMRLAKGEELVITESTRIRVDPKFTTNNLLSRIIRQGEKIKHLDSEGWKGRDDERGKQS